MPIKVGKIEIYVGPHTLGPLDNLEDAIVNFIDDAEKSLDIAVQEVDSEKIAKAIIAAKLRKIRVRLIIENDYLTVSRPRKKPFERDGENEENRRLHNALLRTGIKVKSDFNPKIFHQKFIIRDNASLLTGSTNFTTTGVTTNLNHVVIIHDDQVAKTYGREFREINRGRFGKIGEGSDKSPKELKVSGVPIKILFAPDHNPEMEIMKQMQKGKSRIDFAMFTFSQSSGIDDTMLALRRANMDIRGIMDGTQGSNDWAATMPLHDAGVDLRLVRGQNYSNNGHTNRLRKLHHKLMVIDKQVLVVGSFNYTGPANRLNDENIIVIGDMDDTGVQSVQRQKKLAKYAYDEIERIYNEFGTKVTGN